MFEITLLFDPFDLTKGIGVPKTKLIIFDTKTPIDYWKLQNRLFNIVIAANIQK